MPRGTQAVRGQERLGSHDGFGNPGSLISMVMPDCEKLVSVCWCGRKFLLVSQRDVVSLITYSCNKASCLDPAGNHVPGEITKLHGQTEAGMRFGPFITGPDDLLQVAPLAPIRTFAPQIKWELSHQSRSSGFDVAVRRETLVELWTQQKDVGSIAIELGVSKATVYSDVAWLKKKGLL